MKTNQLPLLTAAAIGWLAAACDDSQAKNSPAPRPPGQPAVKVFVLSPKLVNEARKAASLTVDTEIAYLEDAAREGATVHILDGEACRLVATLRAGHGAPRIRRRLMAGAIQKVSTFFAQQHPLPALDGRLRFPALCQLLSQAHLPPGTPVIVLGNPLFLHEGTDAVFSMKDRVPTDGHLFVPREYGLYSVIGRERALAGLLFYWGFPDGSMFVDDSHSQRVARFWSVYLKAQSAALVTFLPSLDSAANAAAEGRRTPLLPDDPDPRVRPAMLKVVKEIRTEETALEAALEDAAPSPPAPAVAPEPPPDRHGNPAGDAHDLIRAGQMTGRRILFVTFDHDPHMESSPLPAALRAKGFDVERVRYPLPQLAAWQTLLETADQVWLVSSEMDDHFPKTHRAALIERWKAGLDLYLAGDNDPYYQEANAVLAAIAPGVKLGGNFRGMGRLGAGEKGGAGFAPGPLFHGIKTLFEGDTISEITLGGGFQPACRHSAGGVLLAARDDARAGRVVVDGGYTRWFPAHFEQAGAGRLAMNIAGWLAGVDGP